jgi:phage baseplate assembly protein gpV
VDDVVLVLFAHGELASPVVVGQVYSDARRPPDFGKDEAVLQWPGDAGDPDAEAVVVTIAGGGSDREMRIELGGDKDARVRVADGKVELTSGGVTLSLEHSSSSDGTATLAAGGTKVELAQDGDLTIESAGNVTVRATKIELKADVSLVINGQTVEIN